MCPSSEVLYKIIKMVFILNLRPKRLRNSLGHRCLSRTASKLQITLALRCVSAEATMHRLNAPTTANGDRLLPIVKLTMLSGQRPASDGQRGSRRCRRSRPLEPACHALSNGIWQTGPDRCSGVCLHWRAGWDAFWERLLKRCESKLSRAIRLWKTIKPND